jgi:hypothetical protein
MNFTVEQVLSLSGALVVIVLWLARLESRTDKAIEKAIEAKGEIEIIKGEVMETLTKLRVDVALIKGKLGIE